MICPSCLKLILPDEMHVCSAPSMEPASWSPPPGQEPDIVKTLRDAAERVRNDTGLRPLGPIWVQREAWWKMAEAFDAMKKALEAMLNAQSARRHPLGAPDEGIATLCAEAASLARAALKLAEEVK